jgi:hypothetical protein
MKKVRLLGERLARIAALVPGSLPLLLLNLSFANRSVSPRSGVSSACRVLRLMTPITSASSDSRASLSRYARNTTLWQL